MGADADGEADMVKTPYDYAAQALRFALRAPGVAKHADALRAVCDAERAAGALAAKVDAENDVVSSQEETAQLARQHAHDAAEDARDARYGDAFMALGAVEEAQRAFYCAGYYAEVASW